MTALWNLLDTCSPGAFYSALGALLIASAILERVALRSRT